MPEIKIIRSAQDLKGRTLTNFPAYESPQNLLLCAPDAFDVIDVKNPHMEGQVGKVDRAKARAQWEEFRQTLLRLGRTVHLLDPLPGVEDMVFSANPSFVGEDGKGARTALLSNMRFSSRGREVPAYDAWYRAHGYQVKTLSNPQWHFEGHGDALWHPSRRLVWGGYGYRTVPEVYEELGHIYSTPVVVLELKNPAFYHLDTCLCPLSETETLFYPGAFQSEGTALIRALFPDAVEVTETEARIGFACNAMVLGKNVLIQKGNSRATAALKKRGYIVVELDTSEFMKSGGSVFCMKTFVY